MKLFKIILIFSQVTSDVERHTQLSLKLANFINLYF